jgi:feruloyl esterase
MVVFAWATVTSAQPAVPSSGPTQPRGPGFGAPQRPPPKAIYPDVKPVLTIDQLKSVAIENTTIDSVQQGADGSMRITAGVTDPPAHDRVQVFIGLPARWNGRFEGTGGGGWSGGAPFGINGPLAQGYAAGATDTGHAGFTGSFGLDASSGQSDMPAIIDNAYRGIHDMTVVGKALATAYYGKPPKYCYFVGFSTGGRQGLSEAQRYPDDYDGIVSGCPAINWPKMVTAELWARVVMTAANNVMPSSKLKGVTKAFIDACDEVDGVKDGVVEDPARCMFDPNTLIGKEIGGSTFTAIDADVIQKMWDGPRTRDGKFLWFGVSKGADLTALAGSRAFPITVDWIRYFVLKDPKWDPSTLTPAEFERIFQKGQEDWAEMLATDNPDLSKFRDRGGKLILSHGQADQLIPTAGTIEYYQRVMNQMGGRDKTIEFARLFLIPAAGHGFGGTGDGGLAALLQWVEDGKPPQRLINRTAHGSRPLFPYPMLAKYKGSGSTDDAESFESAMPN